jgi:hypothetical protein
MCDVKSTEIHFIQYPASLRRADAAQVCSHVGKLYFLHVGEQLCDGAGIECSVAIAARQIVSERW